MNIKEQFEKAAQILKDYPRIFTQNPISDQDLEFIMHFMEGLESFGRQTQNEILAHWASAKWFNYEQILRARKKI